MTARDPATPVLMLRLLALLAIGLCVVPVLEDALVVVATAEHASSNGSIFPERIWSAIVLRLEDHATHRRDGAEHALAWFVAGVGVWLLVARGRVFAALCRRVSRCMIAPDSDCLSAESASC